MAYKMHSYLLDNSITILYSIPSSDYFHQPSRVFANAPGDRGSILG